MGIRFNLVKCVSIMLVVVEHGEELLKSKFVNGWVNYVLVVDKSALEMKIDEFIADRVLYTEGACYPCVGRLA